MTRETKIGLLVGLAFIIVIGILLSDHLSSTNAPLAADLRVAGSSLRSGLGEPNNEDVIPPLRAPQNVTPSQTIVTNEELNHRDAAQPPVRLVQTPIAPQAPVGPTMPDRVRQAAEQHGEEIVDATDATTSHSDPIPKLAQHAAGTAHSYEAQSGDSLGQIAFKAYGSSCKANREAIVAANPSLAEDRDLIVAGRIYTIPALDASNSATPVKTTTLVNASETPTEATLTYVVKSHDTLWSIATNEVGTSGAVAAIKELNKTVLNGSDRVRPNMKLRLPAKRIAMAN